MLVTQKPLITLGTPFIELSSVESTNNYALELVKSGNATNGMAVFAGFQTNGRGQMNKNWNAQANQNILTSIIVDISTVQLQNQFPVLAFAALGCIDFLKKLQVENAAIKWSNDLFIKDKKAGGILIETCSFENKRFAVIGIGINVNQKEFENLNQATSIFLENGEEFSVIEVVKKMYDCLSFWYNELLNKNFDKIHSTYNNFLYKKNGEVVMKKENIKFKCTIKKVNEMGELEVENCMYDKFSFGEVSWVFE